MTQQLNPGTIRIIYPDKTILDEIDFNFQFGITPIGFQYVSKLSGNNILVHPSSVKSIEYNPRIEL